jgi:hypothetical protein
VELSPPWEATFHTTTQDFPTFYDLKVQQESRSELLYDWWYTASQFVLARILLRRTTRDGSSVKLLWPSPAQSVSSPSPAGLITIFYCLRFDTLPTWRAKSRKLCSSLCSLGADRTENLLEQILYCCVLVCCGDHRMATDRRVVTNVRLIQPSRGYHVVS